MTTRRNTKDSAAALHAARLAKGWTLQALGDRVGVTREAVRLWESGSVPGPQSREALHDLLGVSWDVSRQRRRLPAPRAHDSAARRARLDAGLTLYALARRVGCSVGHISKIERGLTLPSHDLAGRLMDELDIHEMACLDPGAQRRGMEAGPSRAGVSGPYSAQGAELRSARQRQRLTQLDVARQLEATTASVCCWERGTSRPSHANAAALEQLLGIRLEACDPGQPGRPRTPEQPCWPPLPEP